MKYVTIDKFGEILDFSLRPRAKRKIKRISYQKSLLALISGEHMPNPLTCLAILGVLVSRVLTLPS